MPTSIPIATISDMQVTSNPLRWQFVDISVTPGQTYCYAITFRHKNTCDNVTVFESPRSNTSCNQTCIIPPPNPIDVAFIVDNTASIGGEPLAALTTGISVVLDDIAAASGNDFRLSLVTPEDDQVKVRVAFPVSGSNRTAFELALSGVTIPPNFGNGRPESTDECLNTVINALSANGRINPRICNPPSSPLQINDFSPGFRSTARKLVVMITDHEPGGFCDVGDSGLEAAIYATQAHANCIRINAIQVGNFVDATPIMINYQQATCGWLEQIPSNGSGITDAVTRMFYALPFCDCP